MECLYNCTAPGSNAAAWVQAIGSVFAIFVAAYIPARIAAKERERIEAERKFRAASLAFVLEPALISLQALLNHTDAQWHESRTRFLEGDGVRLEIPHTLRERLVDLYLLGDAARTIHEAVAATNSLQTAVGSEQLYWQYGGEYGSKAHPSIEAQLQAALAATRLAVDKLREVHGV